jgi:hypothetical protein
VSSEGWLRGRAQDLREAFERGDRMVAIHYSCENLHTATDHPPAVSCIALEPITPGHSVSFSPVDYQDPDPVDRERRVLTEYLKYVQGSADASLVHWNMDRSSYGFRALENRARYLGLENQYQVPLDRTFDLEVLIAAEHGDHYVGHPRLVRTALVNKLSQRYALGGKDEADKFDAGDHAAVRRSTEEKVRWISHLAERFIAQTLITDRSVGSLSFAGGRLDAIRLVETVSDRFRIVARDIARRHDDRQTLIVADEYDAQDLFRALLRLFFDDVRPEDYVPEYAGGKSRVDFFLPEVNLAIELKHTRESLGAKQIGEQLLIDVGRYGGRDDVRHLLCVVFDYDGYVINPRGIEADLSRTHSTEAIGVTVLVIDR